MRKLLLSPLGNAPGARARQQLSPTATFASGCQPTVFTVRSKSGIDPSVLQSTFVMPIQSQENLSIFPDASSRTRWSCVGLGNAPRHGPCGGILQSLDWRRDGGCSMQFVDGFECFRGAPPAYSAENAGHLIGWRFFLTRRRFYHSPGTGKQRPLLGGKRWLDCRGFMTAFVLAVYPSAIRWTLGRDGTEWSNA